MSPELQRQYDELCTVIDYSGCSAVKRKFLKKDFLKTIKRTGILDTKILGPSFRWDLCASRLRSGRFDDWDGWEFRSNWAITFMGLNGFNKLKLPHWMGQKTNHLVILGEQGIGDEILFSSALPDLIYRIGHKAIEFQTHPRLQSILERSFHVRCTDRRYLSEVTDGEYCVALADLVRFYRKDRSHFPRKPFLKPREDLVAEWKEKLASLGSKPKIGIAWKSRHGYLDPKDLMVEDATYVNLQYGEPVPDGVMDLGQDPLTDMEGQFALVAALDKVVSVTQTVVHVAGSIGKECHAVAPLRGTGEVNNFLWYHFGRGGSPHYVYGSVKVYGSVYDFKQTYA